MARPIILGVVGDSAAGKTTLTRGLVRVLGEENVTHVCTDDYHCYDRRQRAERNITPLHPDCNYMDIMCQHLGHLHAELVLRSSLQHPDLTSVIDGSHGRDGIRLTEQENEVHLFIPGNLEPALGAAIEAAIWDNLHFASHLRTERLGEFTIGTEL